jgi:hypothetical protein
VQARRRLLLLHCASGCLGTSRGSSRDGGSPLVVDYFASTRLVTRLVAPLVINYSASRRLVIDYFAYARVRVPWHVARLVTPPVVDYSASRNLVMDYFAYAARPGASSRHATRHAAHHAARR